jgi:hypothetical protein
MRAGAKARPWLGLLPSPADLGLLVEVVDVVILVGTPAGSFRVGYIAAPGASQLVLQSEWWSKRALNPTALAQLRACAWRLANDKAAELGWFEPR